MKSLVVFWCFTRTLVAHTDAVATVVSGEMIVPLPSTTVFVENVVGVSVVVDFVIVPTIPSVVCQRTPTNV
jgi:hypothetical protein